MHMSALISQTCVCRNWHQLAERLPRLHRVGPSASLMGVRHALFPMLALGAPALAGLPASRRYSPRQAEFCGLVAGPSNTFQC